MLTTGYSATVTLATNYQHATWDEETKLILIFDEPDRIYGAVSLA
jgi:hypothetical protein